MIEEAAKLYPRRPAITLRRSTLTYEQLWTQIENVARNAVAAGAQPGDRFLYAAKPSPNSVAITLGLLRAGLTLVFVDPFSAPELFASRAALVSPRYVVADSLLYFLGSDRLAGVRRWRNLNICDYTTVHDTTHLYLGRRLPGVPKTAVALSSWTTSSPAVDLPVLGPEQDAIITFTSGTTGDPKGVVHSLATISANAVNFAEIFGVKPGHLVYSEPMTLGVVALSHGAIWQIPHPKEELPTVIDVIFAVPTELLALLDKVAQGKRKPYVAVVGTGAAPVLPSLVSEIEKTFGKSTTIFSVYGMTEMLPVAIVDAKQKRALKRGDLLGPPIGDTQVKIADDGEILVRGSGLMKTYFGREPQTWHPTGDLGIVDEAGRIVMLGRKKNMLIRGNMNIYPSLYEPGITTINGVADAVIVGVPDEFGDDRVVLFIVPAHGFDAKDVLRRVERDVVHHMDIDALPDRVALLAEMPTSGRALKRDMTQLAALAAEVINGAEGSRA
jgi:acyl-CoA synthetase (AMP-forming)/AMP-acid ligase II